jgi:hypothetical protein
MFVYQILMLFLLALSLWKMLDFFVCLFLTIIYFDLNEWVRTGYIMLMCIRNNGYYSLNSRKILNGYLCECVPIGLQANFYYLKRVNHDGFC